MADLEAPVASPPFSRPVELSRLGAEPREFDIRSTESERRTVALWLGVPAVHSLDGGISLAPNEGGLDLRGRIKASIDRICVASLEPMIETIDEFFAIRFERDYDDSADDDAEDRAADDFVREPLPDGLIDLGMILAEQLSLSLSPHPRKDGATNMLDAYAAPDVISPFVVLKGLVDPKSEPTS